MVVGGGFDDEMMTIVSATSFPTSCLSDRTWVVDKSWRSIVVMSVYSIPFCILSLLGF